MSRSLIRIDDALHRYLKDVSLREPEVLAALREETAAMPNARMQISPEQGQFMRLLVQLLGARRIVEVGTFTGYSAISMALALADDATLLACDVSEEYTAVARRYFERAGVSARIDLRIAPALETLAALADSDWRATVDIFFIDADKTNYQAYFEHALELLRPNGVVLVDNTLWGGRVLDAESRDPDTLAIRAFNERLHGDERVDLVLLPLGDGLTLARKR